MPVLMEKKQTSFAEIVANDELDVSSYNIVPLLRIDPDAEYIGDVAGLTDQASTTKTDDELAYGCKVGDAAFSFALVHTVCGMLCKVRNKTTTTTTDNQNPTTPSQPQQTFDLCPRSVTINVANLSNKPARSAESASGNTESTPSMTTTTWPSDAAPTTRGRRTTASEKPVKRAPSKTLASL